MSSGQLKKGKVYLIGAGPGDAKLLTVKGLEKVREADVIIYDRLVSSKILAEARPEAQRIYVGKKSGRHSRKQAEVNEILLSQATQGKIVARLKGGDPFVFGRGGEETSALVAEGIPFEVIPGVSSAHAVPAYAGIPVTLRGKASSLAIVTGHEADGKKDSGVDWEKMATGPATLVFLMGLRNISFITGQLIKYGRSPETPVAVITEGTLSTQKTIVAQLREIATEVKRAKLEPPAVIVIGDVVTFRDQLAWFEKLPLFGKTILITRPRHQARDLARALEDLGAETLALPTIKIIPPESYEALDKSLGELSTYDWVLFTSVNGVDFFMKRLWEKRRDLRALAGLKVAAIGPATARRLSEVGILSDLIPKEYRAEGLLEALSEMDPSGLKILIPRAKVAREILPQELKKMGAEVDVVPVYSTVPDEDAAHEIKERLGSNTIDIVTFTSSSTVNNFSKIVDAQIISDSKVKVACIGPITASTAEELDFPVHMIATEYTVPGLVSAIISGLA